MSVGVGISVLNAVFVKVAACEPAQLRSCLRCLDCPPCFKHSLILSTGQQCWCRKQQAHPVSIRDTAMHAHAAMSFQDEVQ